MEEPLRHYSADFHIAIASCGKLTNVHQISASADDTKTELKPKMDVYGDYRVHIAHSSHSGTNIQAEFSTESQYLGQADNHSQIQETIFSHSRQLSEPFTALKRIVTGLGRQNTRTQTQHIRLADGVNFTAAHYLGT